MLKLKKKKSPSKLFDAAAAVHKEVRAMRLSKPERPITKDGEILEPKVPHDLTTLKDVELGRLYSEFSVMMAYAQACLGWVESKKLIDRRSARITRSMAKVAHKGKVALLEATVDLEKDTLAKEDASTVSDAVAVITSAMFKSYEVGVTACSREMTRRIAMQERSTPNR